MAKDYTQISFLNKKSVFGKKQADEGDYKGAYQTALEILLEDPHNLAALVLASHALDNLSRWPEAYAMAKLAAQYHPNVSAVWTNLGKASECVYEYEESEQAYLKAIETCKEGDKILALNYSNLGATYIAMGEWEKGRDACQKALDLKPESKKGRGNLGLCQLALGDWAQGWVNFRDVIGSNQRRLHNYCDEPWWDGTHGKTIAIWGEQGMGDEISLASMVPDAIAVSKKVVLDVDDRLVGLFQRSFPQAKVYGTRWQDELDWAPEDQKLDASIAMGQLGEYFRKSTSDCPGAPYLTPCPIRTAQWKSHFATIDKPVIGIGWTGGMYWTNSKNRHWRLRDLLPVLTSVDAHWVSLQYKDAEREIEEFRRESGIMIHQYPWATLTKDYDDTASLVASLDMVCSMQTAVIHLAGALGVPTWVCVAAAKQWRYGVAGESMPWYKSVRLFRQEKHGEWGTVLNAVGTELRKRFANVESGNRVRSERDSRRQRRGAQHHPPGKAAGSNLLHSLIATGQRPDAPQG